MANIRKGAQRKAQRVVKRTLADGTTKEYRYKAYKKKTHPRLERDSVAALVRAYMSSPQWRELAPRTVQSYSTYLKPLDFLGHYKVADIEKRHIIEMRNIIASERGNGAANAFGRAASTLFSWAVDAGWIPHSPAYRLKALQGGSLPAWTPEQAEAALAGLPEHYRRAVVLGLYTGQRRGDLCAMRWDAYDGERLHIVQEKTGAVVTLTVHPDLKAELDAWPRVAETILTSRAGRPWIPQTLSCHLPKALQRLGIPSGVNVHGLRKLFAAGMASGGATTHEIAANTGHKTLSMIQLYTVTADQRKLAEGSIDKMKRWKTKP